MEKQYPLVTEMIHELREMVDYYSHDTNRRATSHGTCSYETENGAKCAIGRMLSGEDLTRLESRGMLDDTGLSDIWDIIETPRVKNLPRRFLEDLQDLHDSDLHWDGNGISERGKDRMELIRTRIETGYYA
jgi:hypothetical protein